MSLISINELNQRIGKLQNILSEKQIEIAVFNQSADLYYFTGSIQPLYLFVPADKKPIVMARKAIDRIEDEVKHIELKVFSNSKDFAEIMKSISGMSNNKIGFTFDTTSYATVRRVMHFFPGSEPVDISWDIRMLRSVKSQSEIDILKEAGKVISEMPGIVVKNFKPGMKEIDVSSIIENFFRIKGMGGIYNRQEGILLEWGLTSSGINSLAGTKFEAICGGTGISPANPYGATFDKIKKNTPILIDYAATLEGYHVDQTRMFSWEEPSQKVLQAYEAMLESGAGRPGIHQTWKKLELRL